MEIREITEGVWDTVKAVGGAAGSAIGNEIIKSLGGEPAPPSQASVARTLAGFQQKYGAGASPEVTWQAARKKIDTDPVSTQWINGVVASWSQAAPGVLAQAEDETEKAAKKTAAAAAPAKPATPAAPAKPATPAAPAKPAADKKVEPTITVGGEKIRPEDPRYAALKAGVEKAAKNKSKPGPTVTEAAAAPRPVDEEIYIDSFTDWATRNFNSLPTIMSEYDDLNSKLNDKAKEIFANRDQPTGQTTDVREYLKLALAGNQALSQTNRLWKSQRASALRGSDTDKKTAGAGAGAGGEARIKVRSDMKDNILTQVRRLALGPGKSTRNPVIDDFLRELGFDIRSP